MDTERNRLFIVVGMHRSGTSAFAKSLECLGVNLGQDADSKAEDNPKGFFEDKDIVAFNTRLLNSLGLSWFDTAAIDSSVWTLSLWDGFLEEAKALIRHKLELGVLGLKDPRMSRLLPFWQKVFDALEIEVCYLFSLRRPAAVVQSLMKRNDFTSDYAALLCARYLYDTAAGVHDKKHVVVDYDGLLENPQKTLESIAKAFDCNLDTDLTAQYSEKFVETGLNHASDQIDDPSLALSLATKLYKQLLSERDLTDLLSMQAFSSLEQEFTLLEKTFSRNASHTQVLNLESDVAQLLKDQEQSIFDLASEKDALEAGLKEMISQQTELLRLVNSNAAELGNRQDELHKLINSNQTECLSQVDNVAEWIRKNEDNVTQQLNEYHGWISTLDKRLAEQSATIEEVTRTVVSQGQEKLEALEGLATQGLEVSKLEAIDANVNQLLEDSKQRIEQLEATVKQYEAENHQLYTWLDQERKTVLKPIARRMRHVPAPLAQNAFRIARAIGRRLPWKVKQRLIPVYQKIQRRMSPPVMVQSEPVHSGELPERNPVLDSIRSIPVTGHDVVVFPVIDWHFRVQRPQHLARELGGNGHRVFYLTTTFNHAACAGYQILESPVENVFIVKLNCVWVPPVIYSELPDQEQLECLRASLDMLLVDVAAKNVMSIIDLPFWRRVADAIAQGVTVYDCMDHHAGFSTNSQLMLDEEASLLKQSDLVITTSQRLSDIVADDRENTVIRNAAEVGFFSQKVEERFFKSDKPVVGYYGAVAEWFDMDLVIASAKAYPEWDFAIVGGTTGCDISAAKKVENIHFTGEVPYDQLLGYLNTFDICTIPFKLVELTLCTNPVKVYEYLAAGKPVVTTAMPELLLIEDQIHVAHDKQEYIDALKAAMDERHDAALQASRAEWAQQHDWASRAKQLDTAIEQLYPKVSVIVLTYNNLDLTKACLESIECYTHYPNYEVIIVDNASADDTPAYLNAYAESRSNVQAILNADNLGFSAGNNVGLAAATGDYVVILNNDTYVTSGWMHRMVNALRRNPELGLVGPVTNNIGNEARIEVNYANMEEMQSEARKYTRAHAGEVYPMRCAAFFCVMFSREVYEAVGPMDEDFGVGFFEDDDYCNRVREAGWQIAAVEDAFVHHHLSATFSKMKAEKRKALFERNKTIYEQKWGEWIPHQYRPEAN